MSEIVTFPLEDDFDINALRYTGELEEPGSKQVIFTIPVRKPDAQIHCRVRDGEAWRLTTACLELKGERNKGEIYLVAPELWLGLAGELRKMTLFVCLDRFEQLFLWPLRLEDGRKNLWLSSALDCARLAMKSWTRIVPNFGLGGYQAYVATANLPDPTWPALTLSEIVKTAFKDRYITAADHEILRQLRGEA